MIRIALNTTATPVHTHDCDRCTYLGTAILMGKTFDFWTCMVDAWMGATIIARWSSNGEDYFSAPVKVARLVCQDDPMYRYGVGLFDQWDQYMEDMGYRDY